MRRSRWLVLRRTRWRLPGHYKFITSQACLMWTSIFPILLLFFLIFCKQAEIRKYKEKMYFLHAVVVNWDSRVQNYGNYQSCRQRYLKIIFKQLLCKTRIIFKLSSQKTIFSDIIRSFLLRNYLWHVLKFSSS